MKKLLALVLALCLMLPCLTACAAGQAQGRVVASFYPMYVFTRNVLDGVEGVTVDCMTAPQTGCLHDYQLLVGDMMKLSEADALIICGAGMENYLDNVRGQLPALDVIDCSLGIDLIEDGAHHHEDEAAHEEAEDAAHAEAEGAAHEEAEHAYNAHTWLDAQNAILIVNTIAQSACVLYPQAAEQIRANAAAYTARLEALDAELKQALEPLRGKAIVTFHEAFPYFARAYGLQIAAVVTEEHEEALSPARIAQVIELVNAAGDPPLFTEPQYEAGAAITISKETGAKVYALDPIVTGDGALTAYEDGMRANAAALLLAFGQ